MKLKKILENITGYPQKDVHDDHEGSMALTDLRSIAHRAAALADYMESNNIQELEGWVQAKITKSADYVNAVYDNYMFGDKECSSCEDDDDDDDREDLDEKKGTCCHKCGHIHVKGTAHPTPYFTGEKNCKNR